MKRMSLFNRQYLALAMLVLLAVVQMTSVQAAEVGKTIVATDLKASPFIDATTVAPLAVNTAVEILKRQGGWMQVRAGGNEGWLKLTAVKLGSGDANAASNGSGLGTLFNIATTGRSGESGVTVTTGVRGLGQEELKNAQPDHEAVKRMESFTGARNEAAAFGSSAKLQSQNIEYLGTATTSGTTGAGFGGGR